MRDIHTGHRARMRDRARSTGLDSMPAHEVMELLLYYAIPRQDVNELAHLLIERFGSLAAVLNASAEELVKTGGLGIKAARRIESIGKMVRAYDDLRLNDRPLMSNYLNMTGFVRQHFKDFTTDQTWLFLMNNDGRMLLSVKMCDSVNWADADIMRPVIEHVLSVHAEAAIMVKLVHEGPVKPSKYDLDHLESFSNALSEIEVALVDCIFVDPSEAYSLRFVGDYFKRKEIKPIRKELCERYLKVDADSNYDESYDYDYFPYSGNA